MRTLEIADNLLADEDVWYRSSIRTDDPVNGRYTLYSALAAAGHEITGRYSHRHPALGAEFWFAAVRQSGANPTRGDLGRGSGRRKPYVPHAVIVSVLTPAEIRIAARRLAAARPHLGAIASIVRHEDLWQLCRNELTGVDVRVEGWDVRGRWFGVVVAATPRLGELRRGETIPWRLIAAYIASREPRDLC